MKKHIKLISLITAFTLASTPVLAEELVITESFAEAPAPAGEIVDGEDYTDLSYAEESAPDLLADTRSESTDIPYVEEGETDLFYAEEGVEIEPAE